MKRAGFVVAALALVSVSCGLLKSKAGNVDSNLNKANEAKEKGKKVGKAIGSLKEFMKEITPENEYYIGRSVATNILAKHEYKYVGSDDIKAGTMSGLNAYVNKVGNVVAAAAMETARDGDRPNPIGGWHFTIVESADLNAFATPGGFVFVTTAAVKAAKSEDEMAAILAHEIAHVVRGHGLGTIKQSRLAGVTSDALKATGAMDKAQLGKLTALMEGAIDDMIEAFFVKGYSKDSEFEADKVGMQILASAGYDPNALVTYLETLKKQAKGKTGGFYATHPAAEDRIGKLANTLKDVGGAKKAPKVRTTRFAEAKGSLK